MGKHYTSGLYLPSSESQFISISLVACLASDSQERGQSFHLTTLPPTSCGGGKGGAERDIHLCTWRLHPGSHLLPLFFHWNAFPCSLVNYCQEVKKEDPWKSPFWNLKSPLLSRRQRSGRRTQKTSSELIPQSQHPKGFWLPSQGGVQKPFLDTITICLPISGEYRLVRAGTKGFDLCIHLQHTAQCLAPSWQSVDVPVE